MDNLENNNLNNIESEKNVSLFKNKKIIFLFFLFLIVLGVLLIFYLIKDKTEIINPSEKSEIKSSKSLNNLTDNEKNILSEPSKKKIIEEKENLCDSKIGEDKERCLETLKSLQVSLLKNEDLCEQLDEQKDQCYKNLALNKQDINICQKIEDQNLKDFCSDTIYQKQSQAEGNIEICDQIIDLNRKNFCIESIIKQIGSEELCNSEYILESDLEDKCISMILYQKSTLRGNKNICEEIPLLEYRKDCFDFFKDQ